MRDQKGRQAQQRAAAEARAALAANATAAADSEALQPTGAAADGSSQPAHAGADSSQQRVTRIVDAKRAEEALESMLHDIKALCLRGAELSAAGGNPDTHFVYGLALRGLRSVRHSAAVTVARLEANPRDSAPAPAFLEAPGAVAGQSIRRMAPDCSPSKAGRRVTTRVRAAEKAKAAASVQQDGATATQPPPPQLPQPLLQVQKDPKKRKRAATSAAQTVGPLSADWALTPQAFPKFYRWLKERGVEETVRTIARYAAASTARGSCVLQRLQCTCAAQGDAACCTGCL